MTFRPAFDIALEYEGAAVFLRPSLLAATRLEALHNGFPALLMKIQQHDTTTLRRIIAYAATDQNAAQRFIKAMANKPLKDIQRATLGPALALVAALMMPEPGQRPGTVTASKPRAWAEVYADLFKMATGWLGWPPEAAWNATLPEILHAFVGHTDQLKAIHGGAEENDNSIDPEQAEANIVAGLDPEFDRAGLRALKAMSRAREGQVA